VFSRDTMTSGGRGSAGTTTLGKNSVSLTRRGLAIATLVYNRDGEGLVRAIAAFVRDEKLQISEAALLELVSAAESSRRSASPA
jgi:hypothetical protein